MPYMIKQKGDEWCVYRKVDEEPRGEPLGCHESEEGAKAQMAALYANEPGARESKATDQHERPRDGMAVKALGDTRIGGYGAVWGGRDLTGVDHFERDTDFWFDRITARPMMLYEHGQNKKLKQIVLGHVDTLDLDDYGLWIEGEIEKHDDYKRLVKPLVDKGILGWSSGAVPHLVERDDDGKIKSWPTVEFSLTPTPYEPRTLGVVELRALAELEPALKAYTEAASTAARDASKAIAESTANDKDSDIGEKDMETKELLDSIQSMIAPVVEANEANAKAIGDLREKLEKTPAEKAEGITVEVDEAENQPEYKSLGEFLVDVRRASGRGGEVTKKLRASQIKSMKQLGMNEGVPGDGGFLVEQPLAQEFLRLTFEQGQVMNRTRQIPIGPNANGTRINGFNEASRADGSRRGGVLGYWLGEAGTKTASHPEFHQIELNLRKVAALIYATDELLMDANQLQSVILDVGPEELRFQVEDAIVRGLGGFQPLGILAAPATITVAAEAGQLADTVVSENILNMWARMWAPSRANAVWYINQEVEPQLQTMAMGVGAGGQLTYMPPGGLSGAPYATLMGRPVIPVEYCSPLGDAGDIILADMSQYYLATKGGVRADSSIHVAFLTDETVFRFVYRVDGQPSWAQPLTPYQATAGNTLSPFVILAARA